MSTTPSPKQPINLGHQSRHERRLSTLNELAQEAGCSVRFLQLEISRGHLRATKLGSKLVRITSTAWAEYLERGATS